MQHKTLMYVVGVGAIVIIGVGAWMFMGKGSAPTGTNTTGNTSQTQNTTLKNLFAMGGSNKCTFTSSTQNSQSHGTIFISGTQMRGDFTSVAAGKTVESHLIVKNKTSYVWSDAIPQGFSMSFDAMATQSDANPQASVNPNAQVEYSCSAWAPDASVFELPTTIKFQDMSSLMPNGVR